MDWASDLRIKLPMIHRWVLPLCTSRHILPGGTVLWHSYPQVGRTTDDFPALTPYWHFLLLWTLASRGLGEWEFSAQCQLDFSVSCTQSVWWLKHLVLMGNWKLDNIVWWSPWGLSGSVPSYFLDSKGIQPNLSTEFKPLKLRSAYGSEHTLGNLSFWAWGNLIQHTASNTIHVLVSFHFF